MFNSTVYSVTMVPTCTIFDTFDFQKHCNLEIWVSDHSRSWNHLTACLLASNSNFVSKLHRF